MADRSLGDAAQDEPLQRRTLVRAHHDQIDVRGASVGEQRFRHVALDEVRLDRDAGHLSGLAREPLEPRSGAGSNLRIEPRGIHRQGLQVGRGRVDDVTQLDGATGPASELGSDPSHNLGSPIEADRAHDPHRNLLAAGLESPLLVK